MSFEPALAALGGLFVAAFLSATLLPGSSELLLVAMLSGSNVPVVSAVAVATLGNTLGGLTSYALGRLLPLPADASVTTARALHYAQRFGVWMLVFSWVPIIGDALCVASGWLRHSALAATCAIAIGKLARYAALAWGVHALLGCCAAV